MEGDWHLRGHPLHESSAPTSLPTLPSVAELIASSRPRSDTIPAYHHPPSNPLPPMLYSASQPASALTIPATLSSSSEQSYFSTGNHASHASPTGSATSTTPSERHHYQQSSAQPAATYSTSTSTSEAYQNLQEPPHSLAPINARRQDSAVSHHRETSKEGLSLAPPSESHSLYSHHSPNNSPHSTSPGLPSYSIPQSPVAVPTHIAAPSTRSHEHLSSLSVLDPSRTGTDPLFSNIIPSIPQDHTTRQQRYNVRFAAVHTSANMPAAQRSRPSPPPTAATVTIHSPSAPHEDHVEPTIEPAVQALTRSLKVSEEPSQPDARGRQSSVERCPRCYEAWSKPLMRTDEWQDEQAESTKDFARATDILFARLKQYGKDTDEKYEQWKEKHSRCPSNDHRDLHSNGHRAASTETPHNRAPNGQSRASGQSQGASNKRKSEVPHGDNSKLRRVLFDATPNGARPSSPI